MESNSWKVCVSKYWDGQITSELTAIKYTNGEAKRIGCSTYLNYRFFYEKLRRTRQTAMLWYLAVAVQLIFVCKIKQ